MNKTTLSYTFTIIGLLFFFILFLGSDMFAQIGFLDRNSQHGLLNREVFTRLSDFSEKMLDKENDAFSFKVQNGWNDDLEVLLDSLNEYPHITKLKLEYTDFDNEIAVPEVSKLMHIKELSIRQAPMLKDHESLWIELLAMPQLESLNLQLGRVKSTDKYFMELISRLKGLKLGSGTYFDEWQVPASCVLESIYINGNQTDVVQLLRSLKKCEYLKEIGIRSDLLDSRELEMLSYLTSVELLELNFDLEWDSTLAPYLKDMHKLQNLRLINASPKMQRDIFLLPNLKSLHVYNWDKKKDVIPDLFYVSQLEELMIFGYQNEPLFYDVKNLTNLKKLKIQGGINQLPESISSLQNLEDLDLSYNEIENFPEGLGSLTNLKSLQLQSNKITSIPQEVKNLEKLEVMHLSGNEIEELPKGFYELKNLKSLQMSRNKLVSISKRIGNLANLEKLNLSNNRISSLPDEIGNLNKLTRVDINKNELTSLPQAIGNLSHLTRLNLSENKLSDLPKGIFSLPNLSYLNLLRNENMSDEILPQVLATNAEELHANFNYCGIDRLPTNGWRDANFHRLDLSGNNIDELPDEFFQNQIEVVDLRKNNLKGFGMIITDERMKKLLAYKKGLITIEELAKEKDLVSYIDSISNYYYISDPEGRFDFKEVAIQIDPIQAMDRGFQANNIVDRFKDGERESLLAEINEVLEHHGKEEPDFETARLRSIRHNILYDIGDIEGAIRDLESMREEMPAVFLDMQIGSLYMKLGKMGVANKYIDASLNGLDDIDKSEEHKVGYLTLFMQLHYIKSDEEAFDADLLELSNYIDEDPIAAISYKLFHALKVIDQDNFEFYLDDLKDHMNEQAKSGELIVEAGGLFYRPILIFLETQKKSTPNIEMMLQFLANPYAVAEGQK